MKASIAQLMQQAQKLQEGFKQAQQELARLEVIGRAGGGMVEVRMSGRHEVRSVRIDPEAMHDRELLEDLVTAACNDAVNRIQQASEEKLSGLAGGLPIPPGFTLP